MNITDERSTTGFSDEGQRLDREGVFDLYAFNWSPLFLWGVRRMRWLHRHPKPFSRYRRRVAVVVIVLSVCLTLLFSLGTRNPYGYSGDAFLIAGLILIAGSVIGGTLSDLLPVASITHFYRRDSVHHDLLSVTPLSTRSIITAYHELTILDNWRVMTAMTRLRIASAVLLVIGVGVNFYDGWTRYGDSIRFGEGVLFTLSLAMIMVSFVLEPRWRLRGMSALAMMLAVRLRHEWLRLFANILLIIAHWLLLLLYLGLILYFITWLGSLEFAYMMLPLALYFGFRGGYALIETRSLSHAEWRMFRQQNEV